MKIKLIKTKILIYIETLLNLYYFDNKEILIFDNDGIPIDSYISYKKIGKLSGVEKKT